MSTKAKPKGRGPESRRGRGQRSGRGAATRRVVGQVEWRGADSWRFVPFDKRENWDLELGEVGDARSRDFVVIEAKEGRREGTYRDGRVVEVLGLLEEPGVDVLVLLRHHGIPDELDPEAVAEAQRFPENPSKKDRAGRMDLRDQVVVTIDGETARDFDDAISVERTSQGNYRVGVHIADVSHYVRPESALDDEARRRGTSVYYPDRAIPMLPEVLSNGLCSLRPEVDRLTLSAFLEVDTLGRVRSRRFAETVIRSRRRMTYDEVRRILEHPRPEDEVAYGEVLLMLIEARSLMQVLHRARQARGSLDFDLPSGDVILDTDGSMVGVRPGARHVAHRIIEELMIVANEAVGEELESRAWPAVFRVHDPPDPERIDDLRDLLEPMGIEMEGEEPEDVRPRELQAVLRSVEGTPDEAFVHALVLRSQKRAIYSTACTGHFALASPRYLHFTSPIRRYPDLVVHRQLKRRLADERVPAAAEEALEPIADHCSQTERRAERSERDLLQWKKVRFLAERRGERFRGHVTGVQGFGLFVQLDDWFVDGLVPVASLRDDDFELDADGHSLVGRRSGRSYRLAQPVEVRLVGVDARHRGLDLELVSDRPTGSTFDPPRNRRGRGPRRRRGRS